MPWCINCTNSNGNYGREGGCAPPPPPPSPCLGRLFGSPPPFFWEGKPGQGKGIQGVANREATCAIYQQGKGRVLQEAAVISSDIPIRPSLLTNHTTHPPTHPQMNSDCVCQAGKILPNPGIGEGQGVTNCGDLREPAADKILSLTQYPKSNCGLQVKFASIGNKWRNKKWPDCASRRNTFYEIFEILSWDPHPKKTVLLPTSRVSTKMPPQVLPGE